MNLLLYEVAFLMTSDRRHRKLISFNQAHTAYPLIYIFMKVLLNVKEVVMVNSVTGELSFSQSFDKHGTRDCKAIWILHASGHHWEGDLPS